ncbi:hypothetical protein LZ318_11070 [Saccharopolyspora indica]|uniref:jacalin-like lectin n=1 Tax=Saccharopolyspora indica TaxID=1229659 RepID=UPI0022EABBE9|nr:jacalin-like lectin [Saccharopolyspora indica]MDA3645286.1 jacalin-like lectin [Saccharopolyspora indica]
MAYTESKINGGSGGADFRDTASRLKRLTSIMVRAAKHVDAIQCTWMLEDGEGTIETGKQHGGNGGQVNNISLAPGELIVKVTGTYDWVLNQISFTTNQGHVFGPFGEGGGTQFTIDLPRRTYVGGFVGREGDYIDAIGVLYGEPSY